MDRDTAFSTKHCPQCGQPVINNPNSGLVACSSRPGTCGWVLRFDPIRKKPKKK